MKKAFKKVYHAIARVKYKKYIVVLALGVLIVGFLGDSTVVAHIGYRARKAELQKEKDYWEAEHQRNQHEIDQLLASPREVERKARELYFMKADDEDIFIMSSDDSKAK